MTEKQYKSLERVIEGVVLTALLTFIAVALLGVYTLADLVL